MDHSKKKNIIIKNFNGQNFKISRSDKIDLDKSDKINSISFREKFFFKNKNQRIKVLKIYLKLKK